jgi:hypothetical protein
MCKKSETINQLSIALVKAQSEIKTVSKDRENPHFKKKYATLDNIIDETRPVLAKHGLAILQMPGGDGENVIMRTMLMHESGEWLETEPLVMRPVKNDPQGMGSCITYARRYSYSALLSISTEEDDDGNGSSHAPQTSYSRPSNQPAQSTTQQMQQPASNSVTSDKVSEPQLRMIGKLKNEKHISDDDYRELLLAQFGLNSSKDLSKRQASEFIKYLQESA